MTQLSINLSWIPYTIIDITNKFYYTDDYVSEDIPENRINNIYLNNSDNQDEFYYTDNNDLDNLLLIINFTSGRELKLLVNKYEYFSTIITWMYNNIEWYNPGLDIKLKFINDTKEISYQDLLLVSEIDNMITCIIMVEPKMISLVCSNCHYHYNYQLFNIECAGEFCSSVNYGEIKHITHGILLPENVNIYDFPDTVPQEHISNFTYFEWEILKEKIKNHLIEYKKIKNNIILSERIKSRIPSIYKKNIEDDVEYILSIEEQKVVNYMRLRFDRFE